MLIDYTKLHNITYPVYFINEGILDKVDGIVYMDDMILDDTNMPSPTLGGRRLQTHTALEDLYPLPKSLSGDIGLIKNPSGRYIDHSGKIFIYQKTRFCKVKYHKIRKIEPKEGKATVLWLDGVRFPYTIRRPPEPGIKYAGVIYLGLMPWLLYEFSEEEKSEARRKI